MRPKVYVETSVISYLAAQPSREGREVVASQPKPARRVKRDAE